MPPKISLPNISSNGPNPKKLFEATKPTPNAPNIPMNLRASHLRSNAIQNQSVVNRNGITLNINQNQQLPLKVSVNRQQGTPQVQIIIPGNGHTRTVEVNIFDEQPHCFQNVQNGMTILNAQAPSNTPNVQPNLNFQLIRNPHTIHQDMRAVPIIQNVQTTPNVQRTPQGSVGPIYCLNSNNSNVQRTPQVVQANSNPRVISNIQNIQNVRTIPRFTTTLNPQGIPQGPAQGVSRPPNFQRTPQGVQSIPIIQAFRRASPQPLRAQPTTNQSQRLFDLEKQRSGIQNEKTNAHPHSQKQTKIERRLALTHSSSYSLISFLIEVGATINFREDSYRLRQLNVGSIEVEGVLYSAADLRGLGEKYLSERGYGDDEGVESASLKISKMFWGMVSILHRFGFKISTNLGGEIFKIRELTTREGTVLNHHELTKIGVNTIRVSLRKLGMHHLNRPNNKGN